MLTNNFKKIKDFFHAKLCYHLFVTPLNLPLEKKYRKIARLACEYLENERSEVLQCDFPRHYVLHRFAQQNNPNAKRILLLHGWMSRAAYMARLIRSLHQAGFDVYAVDLPAHGEAKGMQLPWTDAAAVVKDLINKYTPYAVIGHSFGGAMILSTLNLANKYPVWKLNYNPEKIILLASPTRLRTPLLPLARQFKLSAKGYLHLRKIFLQRTVVDLKEIGFKHYIQKGDIPVLCIHGEDDIVIPPSDSVTFCQKYSHALLSILPDVDHVNILFDERVEDSITKFLDNNRM